MQTKKIVLLIVEGPSDESALGPILKKIISNKNVRFKVTETDITGDYSYITIENIEMHLAKHVRRFLASTFHVEDLLEIIHIVDTDGAFIDDSSIIQKSSGDIKYLENTIETRHKSKIERRNQLKSEVLNHLVSVDKLEIIKDAYVPYKIFFMSCNLDHLLHDIRNLPSNKKIEKANEFSDSFHDKEKDFIDFLLSSEINVKGNYEHSWQVIQNKNNSLARGSNFSLYLIKYKN